MESDFESISRRRPGKPSWRPAPEVGAIYFAD